MQSSSWPRPLAGFVRSPELSAYPGGTVTSNHGGGRCFALHWRPSRAGADLSHKGLVVKGFLASLGVTLALAFAPSASAQTPEQIKKFQELSAEQRDAAIKAAEQAVSVQRTEAKPLEEPIVVTPAPPLPAGPSAIEQRYASRTDAANLTQTP